MNKFAKYIIFVGFLVVLTACGAKNQYLNDAEISYVFQPIPIHNGDISSVLKEFHSIELNPVTYGEGDPIAEKYHLSDQNSQTVIILIRRSNLQISQYPAKNPKDKTAIETRKRQVEHVVERLVDSGNWKVTGFSE